jgi:hypothetical protein
MENLGLLLDKWTQATTNLKPGVQRVFHDTFSLAADGGTHLVYGADYRDGYPCLVNSVGTMLTTGGGSGIPSQHFGEVVSLFDRINTAFESSGVNDNPGTVSALAAEVLLKHFGELKPMSPLAENRIKQTDLPYYEPTDEEMAQDMVSLLRGDTPPCGEVNYESQRESMDNLVVVKPEYHGPTS